MTTENLIKRINQWLDGDVSDTSAGLLREAVAALASAQEVGALTTLPEQIDRLIEQHGTLRATARVLEIDPGYLSRIRHGERDVPSDALLRRMGLSRVVAYRLIRPKEAT